jgi:hypothetical protein
MISPNLTIRRLLASVGVLAVVATGCTAGTSADLSETADPASTVGEGDADPDLDTGDDPDGGVVTDRDDTDLSEDDASAADEVDTVTTSDPPTKKPPVARPVAKPATKPATKPAAKPVGTPAAVADGTYEGRLVRIDRQTVTVDLVQVLSGEAARKAAAEAGELPADGTLPNDVYVKDLGKRVTVAVAGDGGFQVYDCSAGCQLVGTTLGKLADGTTVPYGGPNAHVTLKVDHGEVVSFVEIYLP